jgi:hypothetical protein
MKLFKVLIALAIISIGISSIGNAVTYGVASGQVGTTGVGFIDFSLTYDSPLVPVAVVNQQPIITGSATPTSASVFLTGASISKADAINSYLLASSAGGDMAATGLDIASTSATKADAAVSNYNMYGVVNGNLAYAGQYADSIRGESIDMRSFAWNRAFSPALGLPPAAGFAPTGVAPTYLSVIPVTVPGNKLANILPPTTTNNGNSGFASAEIKGANSGAAADTSLVSITKGYQFAQAGGSADPSAYPMGIWAMAVNDKGHQLSGVIGGTISESTYSQYTVPNGPAMVTSTPTFSYNGLATIAPNAQSMGYADKNLAYSNEDTRLGGNTNTPLYFTTGSTNFATQPASTLSGAGGAVQAGQNELFVYSLVNPSTAAPVSKAIFW